MPDSLMSLRGPFRASATLSFDMSKASAAPPASPTASRRGVSELTEPSPRRKTDEDIIDSTTSFTFAANDIIVVLGADLVSSSSSTATTQELLQARKLLNNGKLTALGKVPTNVLVDPLTALAPRHHWKKIPSERLGTPEFEACVSMFNQKPKKGIQALIDAQILESEDPFLVASFLRTPGLDKTVLGDYLGDKAPRRSEVRAAFAGGFRFTDVDFDASLRIYLSVFRLPGEAQKIDRLLVAFSRKYYEDNKHTQNLSFFAEPDSIFILSFSVIILNTDLHSPQIKRARMTVPEFVKNLRGQNNGEDFPRDFLEDIYYRIADEEIKMQEDRVFPNSLERSYLDVETTRFMSQKSWKRRWVILDPETSALYFFKSSGHKIAQQKFDLIQPYELIIDDAAPGPRRTKQVTLTLKAQVMPQAPTPRDGLSVSVLRMASDSLRVSTRWAKALCKLPTISVNQETLKALTTSDPGLRVLN